MSLRKSYPPIERDCYFTPAHAVHTLLNAADEIGLFPRGAEIWECAAGRGHIARELARAGHRVFASDIALPEKPLFPVSRLDFLTSSGPSGHRLSVATNPPYGAQSRLIIAFLKHAFALMEGRSGAIAMLLPFEFDATGTRNGLTGCHPWFVGKRTCKRIRWVNLPQSDKGPMGHHAWYLFSNELKVQRRARSRPLMVAA